MGFAYKINVFTTAKFINNCIFIVIMTRIPGNYIAGQVQLNANARKKSLTNESDETLEALMKKGLEYCDSTKAPADFWHLMTAPAVFYDGLAAKQLLEEKRGVDYVLNLLGYRQPRTFKEKVRYFFTEQLPLATQQ